MNAPVAPPTEVANCALCGSASREKLYPLVDAVWHRPGHFEMARCTECGLLYLSPRPESAHIGFYYEDLYEGKGLEFQERLQHGRIAGWINTARMSELARRLPADKYPSQRHLDVGCGVGGLCLQILKKHAARSVGVDFDADAIEAARKHAENRPAEFFAGTLIDQKFETASFQSVSMIHFLEHSYDPGAELKEAARVLEPGGAIVLEVPSATAWARRIFGNYWFPHLTPQHIVLFSRDTLKRALEENGFKDVQVRDSFAPLVWLSSFVLWYHKNLGGRSRFARSIPVRLFTVVFSLTCLLPMFLMDLVTAAFIPLIGRGDHIRASALRI